MTIFQTAVLQVVQLIPAGKVMSYGQVAAYVGAPRAARQVGWAMHSLGPDIPNFPWWRVLSSQGRITIKGGALNAPVLQRELLEAEGIVVSDDFRLDMTTYQFYLSPTQVQKLQPDKT
jgi:methylated-DNA-protein-cysteine methyltransferase-like protein